MNWSYILGGFCKDLQPLAWKSYLIELSSCKYYTSGRNTHTSALGVLSYSNIVSTNLRFRLKFTYSDSHFIYNLHDLFVYSINSLKAQYCIVVLTFSSDLLTFSFTCFSRFWSESGDKVVQLNRNHEQAVIAMVNVYYIVETWNCEFVIWFVYMYIVHYLCNLINKSLDIKAC